MTDLPAKVNGEEGAIRAQVEMMLRGNVPPTRIHAHLIRTGINSVSLEQIMAWDREIEDRFPIDPLAEMLELEPGQDIGIDPVYEMVKVLAAQRNRFNLAVDPGKSSVFNPVIVASERNAYWALLKDFLLMMQVIEPPKAAHEEVGPPSNLPDRAKVAERLRKRLESSNGKMILREIERVVEFPEDDDYDGPIVEGEIVDPDGTEPE
jgi:hypothetical protein